MFDEIVDDLREGMSKTIESLERDLGKTRTGRANLAILDGVRVEYYGAMTPLNQVAALNIPDPRLISITPWDKTMLATIERAIISADVGITPSNDGEIIRLPIPPLTQERRVEICKQVRSRGEETKIALRNCRRDANEFIKSEEGTSEDDVKRALKVVQDHTDKSVKSVDDLIASKESEIMEI